MSSYGRIKGARAAILVPTFTRVLATQAAPVQNTWYPVATLSNVGLYNILTNVAATGEDVEVKIVIDGHTITGGGPHVAATAYGWRNIDNAVATEGYLNPTDAGSYPFLDMAMLYGRSVVISMRKSTNAGVGLLSCRVTYAQW